MKEIWKDIKDYKGLYQVSNLGRIKSLPKKRGWANIKEIIRKQRHNKDGYMTISLWRDNIRKEFFVHRLVAQQFLNKPNKIKLQVNHKDGNKENNNYTNLEWLTCSENHKHAFKLGLKNYHGENHSQNKLTEKDVLYIRKSNKKQSELADIFKVNRATINVIIKRITWNHI